MIRFCRKKHAFSLPARFDQLEQLGMIIDTFLQQARGLPEPEADCYAIKLAVHEIVTNVIDHAYKGRSDGAIDIELILQKREFVAQLSDSGVNFNLDVIPEPDLEHGQIRGYGLFLVEQLMNEVVYQPLPQGNRWRLVKRW